MRSIALLGSSPPSSRYAENLPSEYELWGMNASHTTLRLRKPQRWFQMHHRHHNAQNGTEPGHWGRSPWHEEFLKECGVPVYMQEKDPEIPTSVRYPIEAVSNEYGPYFTSSLAYMLALALYEGCNEIALLGITLSAPSEYGVQRSCAEYYLGIARANGVMVEVADNAELLKAPLYGYEDPTVPVDRQETTEPRLQEVVGVV